MEGAMPPIKVPKRLSTALVTSFGAGVVPRVGLEYVAVGRKQEVTAILQDLGEYSRGRRGVPDRCRPVWLGKKLPIAVNAESCHGAWICGRGC